MFNDSWVELGVASTLTKVRDLIRSRRIELFNEFSFQSLSHQLEMLFKSLGSPFAVCQAVCSWGVVSQ